MSVNQQNKLLQSTQFDLMPHIINISQNINTYNSVIFPDTELKFDVVVAESYSLSGTSQNVILHMLNQVINSVNPHYKLISF